MPTGRTQPSGRDVLVGGATLLGAIPGLTVPGPTLANGEAVAGQEAG